MFLPQNVDDLQKAHFALAAVETISRNRAFLEASTNVGRAKNSDLLLKSLTATVIYAQPALTVPAGTIFMLKEQECR